MCNEYEVILSKLFRGFSYLLRIYLNINRGSSVQLNMLGTHNNILQRDNKPIIPSNAEDLPLTVIVHTLCILIYTDKILIILFYTLLFRSM